MGSLSREALLKEEPGYSAEEGASECLLPLAFGRARPTGGTRRCHCWGEWAATSSDRGGRLVK